MTWEGPDPHRDEDEPADLCPVCDQAFHTSIEYATVGCGCLKHGCGCRDLRRTQGGRMSLNHADEIFERFGYDPDDPARDLDLPEKLLKDLGLEEEDEAA